MNTRFWMSIALATAMAASPALAKSKSDASMGGDTKKSAASQEDQNREPNADGTFQGKPVVQGPADWTKGSSASAGSGSSSSKSKTRSSTE